MKRSVQPELLDELPADDPRALHSRRDLRRINAIMGNARFIHGYVAANVRAGSALSMAEIGAGDGNIAAGVARALAKQNRRGRIILVDRQRPAPVSAPGWTCEAVSADVFDWLETGAHCDVIIANLFLHHFTEESLRKLITKVASRCRVFAACEPRRNAFAEFVAGRVGWIGGNDVTQHDAAVSVRAGFADQELGDHWPAPKDWILIERRAGLFSHFFGAVRR